MLTEAEWRRAQNHTGEHIVSGIVHNDFGYDNVGYHADRVTTVDFSGELKWEQLLLIEKKANEAVRCNIPLEIWYPEKEEIPKLSFRAKLELEQMPKLRLVKIGDIDLCACSAQHVKATGEVGAIKILTLERHRGGSRITMICGLDAIELFNGYQKSVTEISNLLSVPRESVTEGVRRLISERDSLKLEKIELERKIVELMPKDKPVVFTTLSEPAARELCNALMEIHPAAAVFSGSRYIIGSRSVNLKELSKEINEGIGGKGGGRSEMISGTFSAEREEVSAYFTKLFEKIS